MLLTSAPFVLGTGRPSPPTTCLVRDLFSTGPGPDSGGSKPGRDRWPHMPEKSGTDAALCVPLVLCAKAGVATTNNVANKQKSRLCMTILFERPMSLAQELPYLRQELTWTVG